MPSVPPRSVCYRRNSDTRKIVWMTPSMEEDVNYCGLYWVLSFYIKC